MERSAHERARHIRNISQDSATSVSSDHFTSEHGTEHYFQQVSANSLAKHKQQHTAMNLQLIEGTRTILFALSSIHRSIRQCLSYTANEKLSTTFTRSLYESDTSMQSLIQALDKMDHVSLQKATSVSNELLQSAGSAVGTVRKIIQLLQTHLKSLVQISDIMFTRNLLLQLHGAASNVRFAFEAISPLPSHNKASTPKTAFAPSPSRTNSKPVVYSNHPVPPPLQSTSSTPTSSHALSQVSGGSGPSTVKKAPVNRGRSHSEHSPSTLQSFSTSPQSSWERDVQLFNHINIATAAALNVVELLNNCFEHNPLPDDAPAALAKRFKDLLRQVQHAAEMSRRLQSSLQSVIASRTTETVDGSTVANKELTRRFWEDTNACLLVSHMQYPYMDQQWVTNSSAQAIVAMMTLVKAVATQEDYSFPKAVKQGLSQVTRVTAEVARLWSNSTFAEDGYYLGRGGEQG
ncbi:hypothetical protein NQZ79_g4196 [Umbelopsis isabellina]|nr:hypothetical protein NQZ79_g4196 [Umbelopsis isabellina]